jgi:acetoin utilization deacetylase AcuC-like enzyme
MIEYLRRKQKIKRAAILDWDVHHGNGTQEIYYKDSSVLYFSVHQFPLYPGTGRMEETGSGEGEGYTVNFPLPPGSSGADFLFFLKEILSPLTRDFNPDIIAVSAGYDAYFMDPLASLNFTIKTYWDATNFVKRIAEEVCGGKLAILWEGGYHLDAISYGSLATISALAGKEEVVEIHNPPVQRIGAERRIQELKKILSPFWKV